MSRHDSRSDSEDPTPAGDSIRRAEQALAELADLLACGTLPPERASRVAAADTDPHSSTAIQLASCSHAGRGFCFAQCLLMCRVCPSFPPYL